MKNRNIIRIAGCALALLTGFSSCSDFLNVEPKTSLPQEKVYSDLEKIKPAVTGLYRSLGQSVKRGREGFTFSLLGLDESKQGVVQMDSEPTQASLDYYNGLLNSSNTQVDKMWSMRWPVVVSAAQAVYALDVYATTTDDEALLKEAERLKGEACFMRALIMMELAMYWGEIPVIDIAKMENTARQPLPVVWKQIVDDLDFATGALEDEYAAGQKFRATSGAAWTLLGKAYMSAPEESGYRDFAKAKDCFYKVIEGHLYDLEGAYENLFSEKLEFNSPESVFEIDYETINGYQNCWQFDLGSRTADSKWGNGCYFGGYDIALPTEYAYSDKADGGVWENGDLRKEVSIRYDFTYYGEPAPDVPSWGADELDPHIKKWEDKRCDTMEGDLGNFWYSGKNYMYLRYADVLLSYAECLNETGDNGQANKIVNDVRRRAWGGTLPDEFVWNYGQDEFRVQIMDERMRELCFEGWRRFDLIRTGKFVELIKERNPWTKQSGTITEHHMRYPIPETEIKNNDNISDADQNPGYN